MNANRNRPGRGRPLAVDQGIRPGAVVWLVPITACAPTAAYKQPQVTVTAVVGEYGMGREVTVRLPGRRRGHHLGGEHPHHRAATSGRTEAEAGSPARGRARPERAGGAAVVTVDTTRQRPPQPNLSTERTAISTSSPRDSRAAVVVGLLAGAGLAGFVFGWAGIGVAVVEWVALIAVIGAALFAIASVVLTVVQYRRGGHR